MTNKYKISELAKDFNIKSKDLITSLTEISTIVSYACSSSFTILPNSMA